MVEAPSDMFQRTLEYVVKTPKTERQVKDYLFKKGVYSWDAEKIIARLKELNYINDDQYARAFTDAKQSKYSTRVIQIKLRQRGIKSNAVDDAVRDVGDQTELCKQVAEKFMRNKEPNKENFQKLFRHLVGKGFTFETAKEVIDEIRH